MLRGGADIDQRCFLTHVGAPWTRVEFDWSQQVYVVTSTVCGTYRVSTDLCGPEEAWPQMISHLRARYADRLHILAAIARDSSEMGQPLLLERGRIDAILADRQAQFARGPLDQINKILQFVYKEEAAHPGRYVRLYDDPYLRDLVFPAGWARDAGEFSWLLSRAIEMGFLEASDQDAVSVSVPPKDVRLTARGYQRVDELSAEKDLGQAFVAIWFADEMESAWQRGIKPALEETGWRWVYLKEQEHNEKIDDLIVTEVKRSGLVIADFTGHRQNVYFEAGFAMGLGIPVIWTCRSEDWSEEEAHFDTRQYNYIVWDDPEDLKSKLKLRIQATLPYRDVPAQSGDDA